MQASQFCPDQNARDGGSTDRSDEEPDRARCSPQFGAGSSKQAQSPKEMLPGFTSTMYTP